MPAVGSPHSLTSRRMLARSATLAARIGDEIVTVMAEVLRARRDLASVTHVSHVHPSALGDAAEALVGACAPAQRVDLPSAGLVSPLAVPAAPTVVVHGVATVHGLRGPWGGAAAR